MKLIYIIIIGIIIGIIIVCMYKILTFVPNYNNKKIIKKSTKYKPTKLLVVAHPDDDILWGYRYLINKPYRWKVICISGASNKIRANEFEKVMKKMGILNYEILDHNDSLFATKVHQS